MFLGISGEDGQISLSSLDLNAYEISWYSVFFCMHTSDLLCFISSSELKPQVSFSN